METGQAYDEYSREFEKAGLVPVTQKSFERYARQGKFRSKVVKGRRQIQPAQLKRFIEKEIKASGGQTGGMSAPKKKRGSILVEDMERCVWDGIVEQLNREASVTNKTPKLVASALKTISDAKVRRLLTEYICSLEKVG